MLQVNIDFRVDGFKFDQCNALVLPDKKTAKKLAKNKKNASKGKVSKPVLLSKKKRKKLEKVLERKGKKLNVSRFIQNIIHLLTAKLLYREPNLSVTYRSFKSKIMSMRWCPLPVSSKLQDERGLLI